jgi:hypothetical protein
LKRVPVPEPSHIDLCDGSGPDGEACPGPVLPVDPLRPPPESEDELVHERWFCAQCSNQVPGAKARDTAKRVADAVHELDDSDETTPEDYERLLEDLDEEVYPSHSSVVDVKHTLLHLYVTPNCDLQQLHRKEILCREVLTVADKLFPGDFLL